MELDYPFAHGHGLEINDDDYEDLFAADVADASDSEVNI